MTATTTDELAFLSRIAANPADDTDRLVYADWLDESGEPERADYIRTAIAYHFETERTPCTLAHFLAEVEGERVARMSRLERGGDRNILMSRVHPEAVRRLDAKLARIKSLELKLMGSRGGEATGWRRAGVCPECKGTGRDKYTPKSDACHHCWGSGDVGGLLRAVSAEWNGGGRFDTAVPLRVGFERGFPSRVNCRLEDVARLECPDCGGLGRHGYAECSGEQMWRPAPWALAVVRHHPVTQFRVDLPFNSTDNANAWHKSTIPDFLFDLIQGHDSSAPDAAHTAMAAVLAAWVRAFPAGS